MPLKKKKATGAVPDHQLCSSHTTRESLYCPPSPFTCSSLQINTCYLTLFSVGLFCLSFIVYVYRFFLLCFTFGVAISSHCHSIQPVLLLFIIYMLHNKLHIKVYSFMNFDMYTIETAPKSRQCTNTSPQGHAWLHLFFSCPCLLNPPSSNTLDGH